MKNIKCFIFSALFIIALPVCALPWGHVKSIDDSAKYDTQQFLLGKIIREETITYCIDGNVTAYGFDNLNNFVENFKSKGNVFDYWFLYTWKQIQNAGREKDFADLKKLLTTPVKIKLQQCAASAEVTKEFGGLLDNGSGRKCYQYSKNMENIRFIFSDGSENYQKPEGCQKAFAVFRQATRQIPPAVITFMPKSQFNALYHKMILHEIGHSFGLEDQYANLKNASDIYKTKPYSPSIMTSVLGSFSCDDADGLINLIDRLNGYKRGGKEGWKGLCKDRVRIYADAQTIKDKTAPLIDFKQIKEAAQKMRKDLNLPI